MSKKTTPLTAPKNELSTEKSFADGYNFYKLFWVFFIGCFVGTIIEMFFCFISMHVIESRAGVIYGPFNPVYGFGAVLMTVGLQKFANKHGIFAFIGSAIIGTAFEYFCSLFQELAFGTISWEYSDAPMNLHGRVALSFSVAWGLLGLIWIKGAYPWLSKKIEKIPNKVGKPLTIILTIFMVFNLGISAIAVARQTARHNDVPATNGFTQFIDRHYTDEYLKKIYPHMEVVEK
ncbi:MAG: putative ABC transporter permease [Oscillospiraceae bacterium]